MIKKCIFLFEGYLSGNPFKMEMKELSEFLKKSARQTINHPTNRQIQLELYKIKQQFMDSHLKNHECKIALAKLAYIAFNGVSIDFGIPQVVTMISSKVYSQIQIGWMTLVAFSPCNTSSLSQVIPVLQQQLLEYSNEPVQCIALSVVSQLFSKEIMEVVGPEIAKIAVSPKSSEFARKKALITVARIFQITQETYLLNILAPALKIYLESASGSIQFATSTLVLILMNSNPGLFSDIFETVLSQLSSAFGVIADIPAAEYCASTLPWYAKQLIRILRYKTTWDRDALSKIEDVSSVLFHRSGETVGIRSAISYLMVFSEISYLFSMIPISEEIRQKCAQTLSRYLETDRSIIIYFALDSLNRLLQTTPRLSDSIQHSRPTLFNLLRSQDTGISKLSLQILLLIGNNINCKEIVTELLNFIPSSPIELRKDICTKASLLAQSYSTSPDFFVDTVISILTTAGEYCSDSIWHSATRFIACNEKLQQRSVAKIHDIITSEMNTCDQIMKLAVYVFGEFANDNEDKIFQLLIDKFASQSTQVQPLILTAISKICSRFRKFQDISLNFLEEQKKSQYVEVSERAKQYLMILSDNEVLSRSPNLLKRMPNDFSVDQFEERMEILSELSNQEYGVSSFEFNDDVELPPNDQLLQTFVTMDSGYMYKDEYILVFAEIVRSPPQVSINYTIQNIGSSPIEAIDIQIDESDEINVSQISELPETIEAQAFTQLLITFLFTDIVNNFPMIRLCFNYDEIEPVVEIPVPIFFPRLMQSLPISKESFRNQWLSISHKDLQAKVPLKLNQEDPIEELEKLLNDIIGLEPLKMGQPPNFVVGCGFFRCIKTAICVMLQLVYNKTNNQALAQIRCTSPKSLQIIKNIMISYNNNDIEADD